MSTLTRLNKFLSLRNTILRGNTTLRCISTSDKKSETASALAPEVCPAPPKVESTAVTNKNWVSYGFDYKNESDDRSSMKASFFFSVTLCIVWGTFVWSYLPDTMMQDWAQREGYLELRRKEAAGLEPVSRDYIDPSQIVLPSDEELGNTEIII